MDGVHTELGVMRHQLGKLEAVGPAVPAPGAPVFASDAVRAQALGLPRGVQGVGEEAPASAAQDGSLQGDGADAAGPELLHLRHRQQQGSTTSADAEGGGAQGQAGFERRGKPPGKGWWWWKARHLSREQAAGLAAAVGSGAGAVVGALLVAYFSSR